LITLASLEEGTQREEKETYAAENDIGPEIEECRGSVGATRYMRR
jgi:hypothetical protein